MKSVSKLQYNKLHSGAICEQTYEITVKKKYQTLYQVRYSTWRPAGATRVTRAQNVTPEKERKKERG